MLYQKYAQDEEALLETIADIVKQYILISKQQISDSRHIMDDQGKKADRLLATALLYLPVTERYYREKREEIVSNFIKENGLPAKVSAYERETIVKGKTAKYREVRDTMVSIIKFLTGRISLIQSFIKNTDKEKHGMGG